MEKYILSIDQGTTSSRAILFDHFGHKVAMAQEEVNCLYPKEGCVECDANEIYISVVSCVTSLMVKANIGWNQIDSVGITNQRETTIVWDKETGMPVHNAIVWQSRQTVDICEALADKKDFIHKKTGLLINPYFSASKIRYILDHIPSGQKRAENGELLFGTVDTWLIYKMTGGKSHLTDVTNASRTLLFNIFTMDWDDELLNIFNIPHCMLPKVVECAYDFGELANTGSDVHICGVAGDQQASLFGHNCFEAGQSKNTYGTGCFMLMNTGEKPVLSENGLLTTIAWKIKGKTKYALEGSVFMGGACVQWLRDGLKVIKSSSESEEKALKVESSEGVYVVPAFVGLGTPYWDDEVRGTIFGMTRATTINHVIRATLEAIAFQSKDVFDVMEKDSGVKISSLQVDGGATANNVLIQFQSDILGIPVSTPACLETTGLGAAYIAGIQTGFWSDKNEISKCHEFKKTYLPNMDQKSAIIKCEGWKKAVQAAMMFKPNRK